jgi:hypothetical protein
MKNASLPDEVHLSLRWARQPEKMVRELFKVEPDAWQDEALRAFATHKRVALKACKGPGKTTVLAWCAWNFLGTRPFSKVIATSITGDNLMDGLWSEMAKWYGKSAQLQERFKISKTKIVHRLYPETWFMAARQWSKDSNTSQQNFGLAGKHADYILFLMDEVGGIPDSVLVTAEGALASGIETKMVIAGNPTQTSGPLFRAFNQDKSQWYGIEITGDPDDPKRSPRVDKEWAREQIKKWGPENPWVLTNVFGKFPPSDFNSLLGPDQVNEAMARTRSDGEYSYMQARTGTDLAFGGDDRTVIIGRQGLKVFKPEIFRVDPQSPTMSHDIAARILRYSQRIRSEVDFVDATGGYATGVLDALRILKHKVVGINFASQALNPEAYYNKRTEMWWEMKKAILNGACLPNEPDLVAELTSPTYTLRGGKYLLEPKDMVKLKIHRSPDIADALALTYAAPDVTKKAAEVRTLRNRPAPRPEHKSLRSYNPLDRRR